MGKKRNKENIFFFKKKQNKRIEKNKPTKGVTSFWCEKGEVGKKEELIEKESEQEQIEKEEIKQEKILSKRGKTKKLETRRDDQKR